MLIHSIQFSSKLLKERARERERAGQDGKEEWERETEKTQYELFESVQIMVGDGA